MDTGHVQLFRSGWATDYNDPLAMLQMLRSDSGVNFMHYRSGPFDRFLDEAANETDPRQRMLDLQQAERTVLEDAPVIPLFFHVDRRLVKPDIRGWYDNVMDVVYSKDLSLAK